MSASLDAAVWREHEAWLERRPRLRVERERWTDADWSAVRSLADREWELSPAGLYVYEAEHALRKHQNWRIDRLLAYEAEHGPAWLAALLERTAA
jgi:hypothetical protein